MSNNEDNGMKQLLLMIGGIVALAMVLERAALIVENYIHYLPQEGIIPQIFWYLDNYGTLALILTVSLAAVWDKSELLRLIILVCCAAIIILQFFPDVQQTIEGYIGVKPLAESSAILNTKLLI